MITPTSKGTPFTIVNKPQVGKVVEALRSNPEAGAIFSDLDNTLGKTGMYPKPPRRYYGYPAVVRGFQDQGVEFGLVTGRSGPQARRHGFGLEGMPILAMFGCVLEVGNTRFDRVPEPDLTEVDREFARIVDELTDQGYKVAAELEKSHTRALHLPRRMRKSVREYVVHRLQQLAYSSGLHCKIGNPIEVGAESDKGEALTWYLSEYRGGRELSAIVVAGDSPPDLPLFLAAKRLTENSLTVAVGDDPLLVPHADVLAENPAGMNVFLAWLLGAIGGVPRAYVTE